MKLSYVRTASIGMGFFAISLVWMTYNTFIPIILGNFIESKAIRGAVMGLDNLLAVFLIPFVGAWSDKLKGPFGKRLPFLMVGMPLSAILFSMLPFVSGALWTLMAVDMIFLIAMTLFRAPAIALMPDHTHPEQRSLANGMINFMGGLGNVLALLALGPLYDTNMGLPFWCAGIGLILSFTFLWFVIDRNPPFTSSALEESDHSQAVNSLGEGLKMLMKPEYRFARYTFLSIFFFFSGYAGVEAQFSIYATERLGLTPGMAAQTLGFFAGSFLLFALPAGVIGTKLGQQAAMSFGILIMSVAFAIAPFVNSILLIKALLAAGGIGWALIIVQAYPWVAGLGGKSRVGLMTGLYYFFSMSASIISPFLMGLFIDFIAPEAMFVCSTLFLLLAFGLMRYSLKLKSKSL